MRTYGEKSCAFETSFEDSWVRDTTVTSRKIRRAGFREVLDANRERQN